MSISGYIIQKNEKDGEKFMGNEDRPDLYYIPDNVNDGAHFFNIKNRNLVETLVFDFLIIEGIRATPFIQAIKLCVGIFLVVIVSIFSIVGIRSESITEFIASIIRFKKRKAKLHLRKVGQDEGDKKQAMLEFAKEDIFEKAASKITDKLREEDEKRAKKRYEQNKAEEQ